MIPCHVRKLLASPWTSVWRRLFANQWNHTYLTYVHNTLPLALAVHEISGTFLGHLWCNERVSFEKGNQQVCKYHTKALSTNKFVYFVKADIFYSIISSFYSLSHAIPMTLVSILYLYTSFKSGVLDWQ